MAKYKVGDKVRVRRDLIVDKQYYMSDGFHGEIFVNSMKKMKGKVVTIKDAYEQHYRIEEFSWYWTDEMLELVESKSKLFDWDYFLNKTNKVAVHCKTEEEAIDFCKQMHEHELRWHCGRSYLDKIEWNVFKENTCYSNNRQFSPYSFYKTSNYTILEWSDYTSSTEPEREDKKMTSNFKIKNVKTIDSKVVIVEFSNGDTQKAVCMPGDTFDFEKGIEVCVMKHILGKSAYYKALKDADKQIKALNVASEKAKIDAEMKKRREIKDARRKAARAERKRAARVAEFKEAYLSALREYNGDTEKAVEAVK